ncbi:MAG: ABC transporter substrate-binding protein [Eubacteriales bacterium]|nr:ABC transporter substrate-binding protein [Eubacteriales bacterium]
MKKNRLLLLLVAGMLLCTLALPGCKAAVTPENPTTAPQTTPVGDTDEPTPDDDSLAAVYSQLDLPKPYTVNVYELGNTPADLDLVVAEINKILEPQLNTTLNVNFIGWSDLSTKYSLILAGGEAVDIMHTAPWCYYYTETAKGAFMEITDDFLAKAMPLTKESQIPESWEGTKINGKIYAVPTNVIKPEHKFVAIRDDLREKYDLPELTDWTSYENYLVAIAKNETPESGIWGLAVSKNNAELMDVWMQQYEIMDSTLAFTGPYAYRYNGGKLPTEDDFFLLWDSSYIRDFCKRMQYLSQNGVWSQDAMSGTVSDDDAFANGQGASIAWYGSVFTYGKNCEANIQGSKVGYYDLTPNVIVNAENYNNNMMAIAAASKNPERAGMVLDLLKNNTELYRLYVGGIEGVHYINVDDTFREKGPDADKFAWENFAWAVRRADLEPNDTDPREVALNEVFKPRMALPPTNGFVFDEQPVKNEMAAVTSVVDEYSPMLTLGMVDDVDATIDEMVGRMEQSGLATVKAELLRQYNAWLATK